MRLFQDLVGRYAFHLAANEILGATLPFFCLSALLFRQCAVVELFREIGPLVGWQRHRFFEDLFVAAAHGDSLPRRDEHGVTPAFRVTAPPPPRAASPPGSARSADRSLRRGSHS